MNIKQLVLFMICSAALAGVSACATDAEHSYDETPYEKRTAGEGVIVKDHGKKCETDCFYWKKRAMKAEARAEKAEEKASRIHKDFREKMKK